MKFFLNESAYNTEGKVVGTFTIDNEINDQDNLIAQIQAALEGKAGGSAEPVLQDKTVTPTANAFTVTADSGYDGLDTVTVNAIPNTYVQPTVTKGATTYTPTTSNQTIAAGTYCSGVQTIEGDANLVPTNIVNGKSIFGVIGTYVGEGGSEGEETTVLNALIDGTITSYTNTSLTSVRNGLFMGCTNLTDVSFPLCTDIGEYAFYRCTKIIDISFPACETVNANAFALCTSMATINFTSCKTVAMSGFAQCYALASINLPACTSIGNYAFSMCRTLPSINLPACKTLGTAAFAQCSACSTVSLPSITAIGNSAFFRCYNLKSIYLMGSSVCALSNSNAFTSTPIGGYSTSAGTYGSIFVPASLLTAYQTATNWVYFSSRIVGI